MHDVTPPRLRPAPVGPARIAWVVGVYGPTLVAVGAAFVQDLRLAALAVVALAVIALRFRRSSLAPAWAAPIPILATFAWGVTVSPIAEGGPFDCAGPASLPALARAAEAGLGVALIVLMGRWLGVAAAVEGVRRPSRRVGAVSVALLVLGAPLSIVAFGALARPFLGDFVIAAPLPAVLLPAAVFALANGVLEEAVYRGAMQGWSGLAVGGRVAIVLQAAVYGAAHSGPGFVASPLPAVVALFLLGCAAGLIVRRTGSLLPTIAVHVALDVPLYLFIACRLTP